MNQEPSPPMRFTHWRICGGPWDGRDGGADVSADLFGKQASGYIEVSNLFDGVTVIYVLGRRYFPLNNPDSLWIVPGTIRDV